MGQFFLGEIQLFGFIFPPKNWALCNGQILSIQQNQALFSLLGTVFGGNGTTTFALPNLQSRVPIGQGTGPGLSPRPLGQITGEEQHTLLPSENPSHSHAVNVISNPTLANNTDVPGPTQYLAQTTFSGTGIAPLLYATDSAPTVAMNPAAVGTIGGAPHNNLMPLLTVNFCIALSGIFPSRN
jgi:microcystin-dependent protein